MAGISSQISLMQNANWMTQQSPLDSIIKAKCGWRENRRNGKWRKENKEENDVFPCLVQERKHKYWKMLKKKNPTGLTNFFPPDLGEKLGRKERKGSLTRKLHIYPLLGVLWEIAWLTHESNPCWLIVFFFLFFCVRTTPFLFSIVLDFFFLYKKKKIFFVFYFF